MPESLIDSSNSEEGGMAKWHRFYLSRDYLLEDWRSKRLCADWLYCSNNNSKTLNDYLKNTHFFSVVSCVGNCWQHVSAALFYVSSHSRTQVEERISI